MLDRETASELPARPVHRAAEHPAVRPREVDVLEHTLPPFTSGQWMSRADSAPIHRDDLPALDFANRGRAHYVEGTGLGCEYPRISQLPDDQRAPAARISCGQQGFADGHDDGVCPLDVLKSIGKLALGRGGCGTRDPVHENLAVHGGSE